MSKITAGEAGIGISILLGIIAFFATFAAYINHIVTCIQQSEWLLLIAGCLMPLIGWVNGFGEWFGWWL